MKADDAMGEPNRGTISVAAVHLAVRERAVNDHSAAVRRPVRRIGNQFENTVCFADLGQQGVLSGSWRGLDLVSSLPRASSIVSAVQVIDMSMA